jgi:hypothetical protein
MFISMETGEAPNEMKNSYGPYLDHDLAIHVNKSHIHLILTTLTKYIAQFEDAGLH